MSDDNNNLATLETGIDTISSIMNSVPSVEDDSSNYLHEMSSLRDEFFSRIPKSSQQECVRSVWSELWAKSMLAWWAFTNENQAYLSLEQLFEIEHIYAKNRQDTDGVLIDRKNIENKSTPWIDDLFPPNENSLLGKNNNNEYL